jgi:hypothetical protein
LPERDIINIAISDTHAGSDRAIFPPKISLPPLMADEKERLLTYSNNQKRIYDHLMLCAKQIKEKYKGYKKVFVHNGDAIEGIHHATIQLSAPQVDDHVIIHQQVMEEFLVKSGFISGDELHYVSGTETHTQYVEQRIAKHFEYFGAKFHDELYLRQNGRLLAYVHQWTGAGKGQNEGESLKNALKSLYFDTLKEKREMPDVVIASHVHKATMASYSQNWKTYYAMITPSLQMKTRHGQKVSAFQRNDIGVGFVEVSKNGLIAVREPMLMEQT